MTPKPDIQPRMLTAIQAARYIGMAETTFHVRIGDLNEAGFPRPDELIGKYDRHAIDRWLDRRGGLGGNEDIDRDDWKAAARDGRNKNRRRPHGAQKAA